MWKFFEQFRFIKHERELTAFLEAENQRLLNVIQDEILPALKTANEINIQTTEMFIEFQKRHNEQGDNEVLVVAPLPDEDSGERTIEESVEAEHPEL